MAYRWMPIMGKYEISDDAVSFQGAELPLIPGAQREVTGSAVGIIATDQLMIDGRVSATVEFEEVQFSGCQLVLGRDPKSGGMIVAGLADGTPFMFTIREWQAPAQLSGQQAGQQSGTWNLLAMTGDRTNLRPSFPYDLSATVEGSIVSLEVNGVEVAAATLSSAPSQPGQTGLFCLGRGKINISNFTVQSQRSKAFVVMQFSSPYDDVYQNVIKESCERFKVDCENAADIYGPGLIIQDIVDRIRRSQVIIAEVTPANPNVYFEIGYALALDKPIILLAQRPKDGSRLPFDVSGFRVLFYDDSIGGKPKLEEGLRNHLRQILGER